VQLGEITGEVTAYDPLHDPRLDPGAPSVRRCTDRWNQAGNAALRDQVAHDHVTDRAYIYQMTADEAAMSLDESVTAGACALTFADDDGENINVEWFLEQGLTGRFQSVDEMAGPVISYVQPGNAGVGPDGSLKSLAR
jgi:hypothetical protein